MRTFFLLVYGLILALVLAHGVHGKDTRSTAQRKPWLPGPEGGVEESPDHLLYAETVG